MCNEHGVDVLAILLAEKKKDKDKSKSKSKKSKKDKSESKSKKRSKVGGLRSALSHPCEHMEASSFVRAVPESSQISKYRQNTRTTQLHTAQLSPPVLQTRAEQAITCAQIRVEKDD